MTTCHVSNQIADHCEGDVTDYIHCTECDGQNFDVIEDCGVLSLYCNDCDIEFYNNGE